KVAMDKYEDDVIRVLRRAYDRTWTATAVIDSVYIAGLIRNIYVKIVPLTGSLASAGPDDHEEAGPKEAGRYLRLRDDPTTAKDERYDTAGSKGTGLGSGSHIQFDPNATDPEKTIVHELLHSLREMRGQLNQIPTETVLFQYENEEEFFAMLIGNIYLSEIGREDLRASHIVYQELSADLKTSEGFLGNTDYGKACRRLVNKFCNEEPDVAGMIKNHVPLATKFNPIREFLMNTRKYPIGG